jgi:hypothetical protein
VRSKHLAEQQLVCMTWNHSNNESANAARNLPYTLLTPGPSANGCVLQGLTCCNAVTTAITHAVTSIRWTLSENLLSCNPPHCSTLLHSCTALLLRA